MASPQLIDMSKLPPPAVVVVPDFEAHLAEMKADLIAAYPAAADTLALESEPLTKWLERTSLEIVRLRSEVNDSCLAVMLPYALGADLDQIGAWFDTPRLEVSPAAPDASPPLAAVMEDDESYRERIHLAPRGYTVAGPEGAYEYHGRSASGQVLDAKPTSPLPGHVLISVLARAGDGTASAPLLATVLAALRKEDIRPLTDYVTVQSADLVPYAIDAIVHPLAGPDASNVLAASLARAQRYATDMHRIGRQPTLSGIYAALHIDGVKRVELLSPLTDIEVGETEASLCTAITITPGSSDD